MKCQNKNHNYRDGLLDFLLAKVGERVKEFLENLPNTVSKKQIRQERLGSEGKVAAHVEQNVQHLLLLRLAEDGAHWEEDRTDEKGKPVKLRRLGGLSLLTSGYAIECILFSPLFQQTSRFRYLGKQTSEPYAHLIAFAQRPEIRVLPTEFRTKGVSAMLLGQGLAWVDSKTYQILRMRTDLLEPQPQIGFTEYTTEISYDEHRFGTRSMSFWLPREVRITIDFEGRNYRNTHRYSDYKLFSVESFEKREPPSNSGVIK